MRLILLLVLICFAPGLTEARRVKSKRLPLPLLEVFRVQHPAAVKAVWTAQGNGYRVRFNEFGRALEVTYDQAQQWTLRKRTLYESELPVAADRHLQSSHAGCSAAQITLWQRPGESDLIQVRLSCPGRSAAVLVAFDEQGNPSDKAEANDAPASDAPRKAKP